ncbi:alpha/beta fold hydrolase [Enterovibrio nigricans]|uniref:Pimeloyl-ACP methyl ester carboxylesterase n=1 Tax=Enterovibrio nigricans DSM 22720 TaxID=1121868 RepID=A0A1T4UQL9_9GAMM|nr:alpha/beta hydrolase [Enterovibrio nigricans]PKF51041.1 alpha/beta hydrolase [Enterovibrio nigricans]SKA54731.1 Pimeloyl-ACP methyl ester carboxylesterase [Enterovibrio nigricans DSM 22720]
MDVSIKGSGQSIILLPGLFAGGWIWDDVANTLCDNGYKVISFNQPIPISLKGSMEYAIKKIDEVVSHCNDKPIIAGNSMGALISLEYTRLNPSKVCGLIVSGSPGLAELETGVTLADLKTGDVKVARELAARVFFDKTKIPQNGVEEIASLFGDKRAFINIAKWLGVSRDYNVPQAVKNVPHDIQLIWGDHDEITPISHWENLAESEVNLKVRKVINCGHSPMLEMPIEFSKCIIEYFPAQEDVFA